MALGIWLVLVASLWLQLCAGVYALFANYTPLLKTALAYTQQQITILGTASAFGTNLGLVAGSLVEILPPWCLICIGALHCFIGYGWIWLIVTGRTPILPLWAVCILIFIGSNSSTYIGTATLVTNVYNFPESRGHAAGLLKGFNGISSSIFIQVYLTFFAPDQASYLLMSALGPTILSLLMMFLVQRIDSKSELGDRLANTLGFNFIYGDCLIIAAYLMGVLILQDVVAVSSKASLLITSVLLVMVSFPLATPLVTWAADRRAKRGSEEAGAAATIWVSGIRERVLDEEEIEAPLLGGYEGVEQRETTVSDIGPCRGQEVTWGQALMKVDSWLLFWVLVCGLGTGAAAAANIAQICQSQGYRNISIFTAIFSILNFLGRVSGGYFSELLVRTYRLSRSWGLVMAQGMMSVGHLMIALGWLGTLYASTILIGVGFGLHWGIMAPLISELYGMKSFGILFNVHIMSLPLGSIFFSNFLVGYFYDLEAAKQQQTSYMLESTSNSCSGAICFHFSFLVMMGGCIFGIFLAMILAIRTHSVYKTMYSS